MIQILVLPNRDQPDSSIPTIRCQTLVLRRSFLGVRRNPLSAGAPMPIAPLRLDHRSVIKQKINTPQSTDSFLSLVGDALTREPRGDAIFESTRPRGERHLRLLQAIVLSFSAAGRRAGNLPAMMARGKEVLPAYRADADVGSARSLPNGNSLIAALARAKLRSFSVSGESLVLLAAQLARQRDFTGSRARDRAKVLASLLGGRNSDLLATSGTR